MQMTTTVQSRQIRRAQQRAQAKAKAKQSKLGYIPSTQAGLNFAPDAGVNSTFGVENHYWFNAGEWALKQIALSMKGAGMRCEKVDGKPGKYTIEINFTVDIMDKEGKTQVVPRPKEGEGYMLSMKFNRHQLIALANEIDKGAQGVRLSGIPVDSEEIRGHKDRPETIRPVMFTEAFSQGNNSGSMLYAGFVEGGMAKMTSGQVAKYLRDLANSYEEFARAKDKFAN